MRAIIIIGLGVVAVAGAALGYAAAFTRVAEPPFAIERHEGAFELRRYAPRVVAETRATGSWDEAGNEGFRRLAGYIFGKNRSKAKIAMTAPVGERSQDIPMTAPVGERSDGDAWVVSFTMPAGETLASLPEPEDARVVLREVPATRVAVVSFSGRWKDATIEEQTGALRSWLGERGIATAGEPEVNRYDPPWTPWFMRRNEIWLKIAD